MPFLATGADKVSVFVPPHWTFSIAPMYFNHEDLQYYLTAAQKAATHRNLSKNALFCTNMDKIKGENASLVMQAITWSPLQFFTAGFNEVSP
ncbi:hypothetical protein INT43_006530 [Umbelopsis isabellina]|uniref:Uncharacterized protein n=1 Tax=Mortierella isabellina TaxID=91625 RepID=A0A8H7PZC8_MORIS|nr:hypothetical protein INT43_006530 [Umbelopsis isabellina]